MSGAPTPSDHHRPVPSGGGAPPWPLASLQETSPLRGARFAEAYSGAVDEWIRTIAGAPLPGMAVVAVGGYGRSELCPRSDIDVTLVHRGAAAEEVEAVADRLWYPLWDAGVRVDHSVRSLRDALRLSTERLEVASGLLDGRLVWGDAGLAEALLDGNRERWRASARRRLADLGEAVSTRHRAFGDVAFLLEPDLKEGRGGLRDVVALRAAQAGSPVVPALDAVETGAAVLLGVRVELHRRTRRGDRLQLEEQDGVAESLGYADADALMAAVAAAARSIGRVGDDTWRRVRSWLQGPRGRQGSADRSLGRNLVLRDDEVVAVDGDDGPPDPQRDRSLAWRLAAASAETGAPIARRTLAAVAERQPVQHDPWPEAATRALVAVLGTGHAAIPVFEELDEAGILHRLLPEWSAVRSKPQRNALHRFTVDRHLCETAAEAASFSRQVGRPDLLLVGAWLHDLGKGYPGDHTVVGADLMERLGRRMGFSDDDVATLRGLVDMHLLLPDVATRRDLDDPDTIAGVAGRVGTLERLELLWALARADGAATGPAAWSPWKGRLVEDLVRRVEGRLRGEPVPLPRPPLERAFAALEAPVAGAARAALEDGRLLVVHGAGNRLAVVAPDRPGLLGLLAGVLVINRLTVLGAQCASWQDMVLDVFEVEPDGGRVVDADGVQGDIVAALDGRLAVPERVAERARAYAGRRRRSALPAAERVLFEQVAGATLIEVRAADDLGLLHRVAGALAGCALDVSSARVATLGHEAVDTFTVTDRGLPVADGRFVEIERRIAAAVGEGRG